MIFPLTLSDVLVWLAVTAMILLVTSELIYSSSQYSMRIKIERSRLRLVAVGCGLAFLVTVVVRLLFQPI